ncbi:hypothetical protein HIM_09757 [Hirsutella minnesotensis 3608]|uniref:FAD-binding domain-containing protein n=1 Tax=Hirsutella minnesotensis 3608 TaxID=1043627 RepID=A0A0F7ZS69_9HYPO|nr:hypothetical protein HIM_09757 [Hirsutella minnesotensis 3608]
MVSLATSFPRAQSRRRAVTRLITFLNQVSSWLGGRPLPPTSAQTRPPLTWKLSRDSCRNVTRTGRILSSKGYSSPFAWITCIPHGRCPTWERDGVVLMGDAAHALPPTSGLGSSQALEDAEAFVLFLSHHMREAYKERRTDISSRKQIIKMEYAMYTFMWILGCFPRLMTKSFDSVFKHNVADEAKKILGKTE